MKIVHVCSYYTEPFAKGYQVYQLVKSQMDEGHDVTIVTSNAEMALKEYKVYAKVVNSKSKVLNYKSETGAKIERLSINFTIFGRNWWSDFKKKIVNLSPDVLIIHGILEFQSIRILYFSKKLNCQLIFDDHTTINVARKGNLSFFMYFIFRLFWAQKLYFQADKIIGISHSCIEVLEKKMGLKGKKVQMIPLGADTKIYFPDANLGKKFREKLNIPHNALLVVYTGKLNKTKMPHLVIEALNRINAEKVFDLFFLMTGFLEEDYKSAIEAYISKSINPVVYLGNVSQNTLLEVYNAADIAVWPAHTTTSTLDASACACPIICSEYKKERLKNNNGIGVIDGDLQSLVLALKTLLHNEELRKEMGKKGYELITSEFSWSSIARRFIEK